MYHKVFYTKETFEILIMYLSGYMFILQVSLEACFVLSLIFMIIFMKINFCSHIGILIW